MRLIQSKRKRPASARTASLREFQTNNASPMRALNFKESGFYGGFLPYKQEIRLKL